VPAASIEARLLLREEPVVDDVDHRLHATAPALSPAALNAAYSSAVHGCGSCTICLVGVGGGCTLGVGCAWCSWGTLGSGSGCTLARLCLPLP
jgi:hypothetical protein